MKAMKMKMFKNEDEYNKAIDLLEQIGDREDFQENKELIEQFELLSSLIEAYENENANLGVGNPIDIIKLKMNYLGLKQKDLQPYIGSSGIVSEVLNRKRGLSKKMIRGLSEFLHLDQDLLNTPYDLVETTKKSLLRDSINLIMPTIERFKYIDASDTTLFKARVAQRGALLGIGC